MVFGPAAQSQLRNINRSQKIEEIKELVVAKQSSVENAVYKVIEVIGTSTQSWEDAAKNAVETAGRTLRDLRVAEVVKTDIPVKDGKVQAYRARVLLSFKYES